MKQILPTALIALMACFSASAQISFVAAPDRASLYSKVECSITLTGQWTNPYLQEEAYLDMEVVSPSGKTLTLPCYWVSGKSGQQSQWNARFIPQETGTYSYVFKYYQKGKLESESAKGSLKVSKSGRSGILHVNDNWTLKYDNGELFRGIGENLCWESRTSDDSKFFKELHQQHDRFNYDVMLPEFASNGGNFIRVWMCSWNFPIDRQKDFNNSRYQETTEYMNISAVERLDHMVELAESLGIKIMLCMGQGDVAADRDFFNSETAKARYKNRLRYIVARWAYSESIAMWEFFNEIDNIQFRNSKAPIPAEEIVAWHAEMAKYLRSIDPFGHIVTTSISHRDLAGLNSVDGLDINQKHIYNNTSVIPSTIVSYEEKFGKPYIIGEFGREWDWSKNFDDFADEMDADFRRGLWYGLFSPTPVTPMSWWWEYFTQRNMNPYFKGVRKVSDMMLSESGGCFEMVQARAEGAEAYALKCGKYTYVYVYNPSKTPVKCVTVNGSARKCQSFDFDTNEFKAHSLSGNDGSVIIECNISQLGEALYKIR